MRMPELTRSDPVSVRCPTCGVVAGQLNVGVYVTSGVPPMEKRFYEQSSDLLLAQAYLATILETDDDLMPLRVYEALAIEQRLISPMDTIERRIVEDAQIGLLTLKAERIVEGTRVIREERRSEETC
jgi:hypothetical protein